MLVPPLEAIELGWNVVYLDSDMVFYTDPLPIFLRSQAGKQRERWAKLIFTCIA